MNDEHTINACSPLVVTELRVMISFNGKHPMNGIDQIVLTYEGIEIYVKVEHLLNDCSSIFWTFLPNKIEIKEEKEYFFECSLLKSISSYSLFSCSVPSALIISLFCFDSILSKIMK